MKENRVWLAMVLCAALSLILTRPVGAQSGPTAIQPLQLSVFGGVSAVETGLVGGKNLSLTTGVDLALLSHHGIRPIVEIRGTVPIDKGNIDGQKSVLAGGRFEFLLGHRIHPYADFFFGRGETTYAGGYVYGNYLYDLTSNWVFSPGGGVDFDLGDHLGVRVDAQFQPWSSAPTPSGTIYAIPVTTGIVYRFDFNHRPKP